MARKTLLPPYLEANPLWTDFADAIDHVFNENVDTPAEIVGGLRNMWIPGEGTEAKIEQADSMIDFMDWAQPEKNVLIKQVNLLGLFLTNSGIVSEDGYQVISRSLGSFWYEKGTKTFIDFIGFCLNSRLTMTNCWTEDYKVFLAEGDPLIGTPVWEGGTWYPTTHVIVQFEGNTFTGVDLPTLVNFFYEVSNYNLVMYSIDFDHDMYMGTSDGAQSAEIVSLGNFFEADMVLANF